MKDDIRSYATLGLVHHLLYPECVNDPDLHTATLETFIHRDDMETFDCCLPYGSERRKRLADAIQNSIKEVVYTTHLFPLRKISLASTSPAEQGLSRVVLRDQIDVATEIGAVGFIFASGADVPEAERPAARLAFADFCRWFCGELKPHNLVALLEPFDRTFDKKYLYGPTSECVELIRSLRPEVDNLGIELDFAHLPLMGETFAEAVRTVGPYLHRAHLGNCVCRDPNHPFYGDKHPPIGIEGGEIDVPQLVEILRALLDSGYLNRGRRGALVLEMQPFPGKTPDETVADAMARLRAAWAEV
jgi:sugar phosphate isomerase/epimerase